MGYRVGRVCHADLAHAEADRWSGVAPDLDGGSVALVVHTDQGWALNTYTGAPLVLQSTALVPTGGFEECSVAEAVADGIAVGWLVGGTWLAVYAIMYLARVVRDVDRNP